jgi:hypothetical protein
MEQSTVNLMQQRFVQTGRAIDVSDFKELCFRITEIFISERSEHKGILSQPQKNWGVSGNISVLPTSEAAKPRLSTAEIKRKLPIRFTYDEATLALTELVRIRALDEHVVKGKLFYSRR